MPDVAGAEAIDEESRKIVVEIEKADEKVRELEHHRLVMDTDLATAYSRQDNKEIADGQAAVDKAIDDLDKAKEEVRVLHEKAQDIENRVPKEAFVTHGGPVPAPKEEPEVSNQATEARLTESESKPKESAKTV